MKTLIATALAASLTLPSLARAGGPVVVAKEPAVEAAAPRSGWVVPVVVGLILACAIACGNDDDEVTP